MEVRLVKWAMGWATGQGAASDMEGKARQRPIARTNEHGPKNHHTSIRPVPSPRPPCRIQT